MKIHLRLSRRVIYKSFKDKQLYSVVTTYMCAEGKFILHKVDYQA